MGANVWQRDTGGSSSGTSFKVGPATAQYPVGPGKRKRVWTKDQQEQPATPATSAPGFAASRNGEAPSPSYRQPDHFEKRARMHDGYAFGNGHHTAYASHQPHRESVPKASSAGSKQQPAASASREPAAVQEQRHKSAELAELKRRIQQHEAQLLQQKKQKEAQEAQNAQEARQEQGKRRAKLEAGFADAFKKAKQVADAELANRKAPVKLASAEEIRRVLSAKTDYDCLQVQVGADALTIKRKYKELAVALHPDKCKEDGATDAFQRLVKAYQSLLKYAKQS